MKSSVKVASCVIESDEKYGYLVGNVHKLWQGNFIENIH
jgi:hypothetical protein